MLIQSIFRSLFPSKPKREANPTVSVTQEASASIPIQTLPLELLHEVATYLPICSLVALRQTNRRLYTCGGHGSMTALYERGCQSQEDKLQFLCFLERDAPLPKQRLVCSSCLRWHSTEYFSPVELGKDPAVRRCHVVWLCKHRALTLKEYHHVLTAPTYPDGFVRFPYCASDAWPDRRSITTCCHGERLFFCAEDGRRLLLTWWYIPLRTLIAFGDMQERGLNDLPAELDFDVCPHQKFADCLVQVLAFGIVSSGRDHPSAVSHCEPCGATVWGKFEGSTFLVKCTRWFGKGGPEEPNWSSQQQRPS